MKEVELKLQVPEGRAPHIGNKGRGARPAPAAPAATYFDTPDRRLAAAGLALRDPAAGRRRVQTLKGPGVDSMQRFEHEVELPFAAGVLPTVASRQHALRRPARRRARGAQGNSRPVLAPQFRTDVWRRTRTLRTPPAPSSWLRQRPRRRRRPARAAAYEAGDRAAVGPHHHRRCRRPPTDAAPRPVARRWRARADAATGWQLHQHQGPAPRTAMLLDDQWTPTPRCVPSSSTACARSCPTPARSAHAAATATGCDAPAARRHAPPAHSAAISAAGRPGGTSDVEPFGASRRCFRPQPGARPRDALAASSLLPSLQAASAPLFASAAPRANRPKELMRRQANAVARAALPGKRRPRR